MRASRPSTGRDELSPGSTFGWSEYAQACELAGPWLSHDARGGWFPLDLPLPAVRTCCYVVVSKEREVLYVGRVRRRDQGGMRARFSRHHRRHPGWHAVWVVPLLDTTFAVAVDNTEAALISVFRPIENVIAPQMCTG